MSIDLSALLHGILGTAAGLALAGPHSDATCTLRDPPVLGSTVAGEALRLGGFSGLLFDGAIEGTTKLRFITHTDRGPNAEPVAIEGGRGEHRPFALPGFQPEIVVLEADPAAGSMKVLRRIGLVRRDGSPLTGRSNIQSTSGRPLPNDEPACDLLGRPLPNDPLGVDLEGIARAHDGSYWLCDEYRPSLLHVSPEGRLLERFVPEGSHGGAKPSSEDHGMSMGTEALPAVLSTRRQNRGFEAVAIVGDRLYAILQSPLDSRARRRDARAGEPAAPRSGPRARSRIVRIVEFDLAQKRTSGMYAYLLEGGGSDKIGDATATPDGDLLILERDDRRGEQAQKRVYRVDVRGATNLLLLGDEIAGMGGSLESTDPDDLESLGVVPVTKRLVADLARAGAAGVEKLEGLALLPDGRLAVLNDDDFGLSGAFDPRSGRLVPNENPDPTILRLLDQRTLEASRGVGPGRRPAPPGPSSAAPSPG